MVTIDDKINLFSKIIYDEVDEKINFELDKLKKVEAETMEKEEKEIERYKNKNTQDINKKSDSKYEKAILELRIREQQELLSLKENMIDEILYSLKKRLVDFTNSDEYVDYIKKYLDNTLKSIENNEGSIVYFNEKDKEIFKKIINKKDAEISDETKDIIGGYILQDKNNKFRIDCSLDENVKECKEKIGISITELFL